MNETNTQIKLIATSIASPADIEIDNTKIKIFNMPFSFSDSLLSLYDEYNKEWVDNIEKMSSIIKENNELNIEIATILKNTAGILMLNTRFGYHIINDSKEISLFKGTLNDLLDSTDPKNDTISFNITEQETSGLSLDTIKLVIENLDGREYSIEHTGSAGEIVENLDGNITIKNTRIPGVFELTTKVDDQLTRFKLTNIVPDITITPDSGELTTLEDSIVCQVAINSKENINLLIENSDTGLINTNLEDNSKLTLTLKELPTEDKQITVYIKINATDDDSVAVVASNTITVNVTAVKVKTQSADDSGGSSGTKATKAKK